jgi:hypothetical protein
MATLVAAAIGAGLSQAAGLVTFRWQDQLLRLALGLVGGLVGGVVGGLLGNLVYALLGWIPLIGFVGRVLGWTFMGAAVGVVEGVYDRSLKKVRNGVVGGALGGFLGGLLFNPVSFVVGSPVSSRAIAFVLLGLFVGLMVALVQVVLKEAWLTVEEGFRPSRQLILGRDETTMGTSEKAGLIFIAYGARGVEPIHLRIVRQRDGSFVLHDNHSRSGTLLNGERLEGPAELRDGDLIQFGVNAVRFHERYRRADEPGVAPPRPRRDPPREVTAQVPILLPVEAPPLAPSPKPVATKPPPVVAAKPAVAPPPVMATCPVCNGSSFTATAEGRRCDRCGTTLF